MCWGPRSSAHETTPLDVRATRVDDHVVLVGSLDLVEMRFRQTLIAVLCCVAVIGNPIVVGLKACCCSRPVEKQRSCCLARKGTSPTASTKACCAKRQATRAALVHVCGCCLKEAPPLTNRTPVSVKPVPPLDLISWSIPRVSLPTFVERLDRGFVAADRLNASSLLALLCRWLK